MANKTNPHHTETLEQMIGELEQSGVLHVEWAKADIAEHICLAMRREDVSKAELARRLRKSRAYITQILQGGVNFTIESLAKIATVLNCELDIKFEPKHAVNHWRIDVQRGFVEEGHMLGTDHLSSSIDSAYMDLEDDDNAFITVAA